MPRADPRWRNARPHRFGRPRSARAPQYRGSRTTCLRPPRPGERIGTPGPRKRPSRFRSNRRCERNFCIGGACGALVAGTRRRNRIARRHQLCAGRGSTGRGRACAMKLGDARRAFGDATAAAVTQLYPEVTPQVAFEAPRRPEFGDFASNVAFSLAKVARRSPQDVAQLLAAEVLRSAPELAEIFPEIAPVAGFINLRLAPRICHAELSGILRENESFGKTPPNGARVSLEFGSANPTGPLVVVQGRSMSIGATLANAMRFCGYEVFVEWIINDAGGQLDALGRSIYARYRQRFDPEFAFPEDGYPGSYLIPVAESIAQRDGDRWVDAPEPEWLPYFASTGRDQLVAEHKEAARRFGVEYDRWQSERELHDTGKVREGIDRLRELGLTYELDGALFF